MSTIEQSIEVNAPLRTVCDRCRWTSSPRASRKIGAALGAPERRVKGDLQRFEEMLEERGIEIGAWRGEVARH
jgi:hypothetical protein